MAIEVGTAYLSIVPETSRIAPGIRDAMRGASRDAARQGDQAGSSFGSGFKGAVGKALKGGALAGLAGGSLLAGAGVKTYAELEQMQIGFETMLGSADKADRFLAQIKKTAAKTPFELTGLAESSQKLLAMGFATRDVIPTLTTLGDAAAGLGLGAEGLDRLSTTFGQMQAKGKVQGEELLQLTEAGVPALKILANQYGMSTEQMGEAISDGAVKAEKAIPLLLDGIKNGTEGAAGETAKFGGLMEKQSQSLAGLFSTLKDTLFLGMADAIAPLVPALKDGLTAAIAGLGPVMTAVSGALVAMIDGFKEAVGWAREHKDLLIAVGAALGTAAVALLAYNAYVRISTALTKAWAVAQALLNGTMKLNPVGLVVAALALLVGALVLAYQKSETFRAVVDRVWAAVKKAVVDAWTRHIKPALTQLKDFIVRQVVPVLQRFWNNVVKPVFRAIGQAVRFAWNNVIKPALKAYAAYIRNVVIPVVKFFWSKVVRPVFQAVGAAIKFAWNNVIKPAFAALRAYLNGVVFPVIRFLWNNVVKPAFEGIGSIIKGAWDRVIRPAFDALRDGLAKVRSAFQTAKDKIGDIWEGLKALVARPINFVIGTVYNNGLRAALNLIPGVDLGAASLIPGYATGGWTGPGQRTAPAGIVHADEYVVNKRSRRAFESRYPGYLDFINRTGRLPGFFYGGRVPLPGATSIVQHSGYDFAQWAGDLNKPGDEGAPIVAWKAGVVAGMHYIGDQSYGRYITLNHAGNATLYAHMSGFGPGLSPGSGVRAGQTVGYVGSVGNSSGPHLHFEIRGGAISGGPGKSAEQIAGEREDRQEEASWRRVITDLPGKIRSVWSAIQGMGGSPWYDEIKKAGPEIIRSAIGYADDKIPDKLALKWLPDVNLPDNPIRDALSALGIYDGGGVLPPGGVAVNLSRKPEAVFTHSQFRQYAQAPVATRPRRQPVRLVVSDGRELDAYLEGLIAASDLLDAESERAQWGG